MTMLCEHKQKEYVLEQAEAGKIDYENEKFKGRVFQLDVWYQTICDLVTSINERQSIKIANSKVLAESLDDDDSD